MQGCRIVALSATAVQRSEAEVYSRDLGHQNTHVASRLSQHAQQHSSHFPLHIFLGRLGQTSYVRATSHLVPSTSILLQEARRQVPLRATFTFREKARKPRANLRAIGSRFRFRFRSRKPQQGRHPSSEFTQRDFVASLPPNLQNLRSYGSSTIYVCTFCASGGELRNFIAKLAD